MAHTYQKLTDAKVANYLSDSFLKTRNNHTPNMLKLSHSDRNREEGGSYDSKWATKKRSLQQNTKIFPTHIFLLQMIDGKTRLIDWYII